MHFIIDRHPQQNGIKLNDAMVCTIQIGWMDGCSSVWCVNLVDFGVQKETDCFCSHQQKCNIEYM